MQPRHILRLQQPLDQTPLSIIVERRHQLVAHNVGGLDRAQIARIQRRLSVHSAELSCAAW